MFQKRKDNLIINQVKLQKIIKILEVHKMKKFFENFKDAKFIAALLAMISGIMVMFKCDNNTIALITNIVGVVLPALAYVITSGILDWNKINTAIKQILDIIDTYLESENKEQQEHREVAVGAVSVNKEKEVICKIAEILRPVVRK